MIEFLDNLDTSIFLAVNGANSPFFDSFMTMFTGGRPPWSTFSRSCVPSC